MKKAFACLLFVLASTWAHGNDWPQWMGEQRDGVWREDGILEKFPAEGPKVLWRTPIGAGYSGPAVVGGKVYVMDRVPDSSARKAKNGFDKFSIQGKERVVCLDAVKGEIFWKYEYDCPYDVQYSSGPRITPAVVDGKVYTVGAEGNVLCLSADKGEKVWEHEFKKELKWNDLFYRLRGIS